MVLHLCSGIFGAVYVKTSLHFCTGGNADIKVGDTELNCTDEQFSIVYNLKGTEGVYGIISALNIRCEGLNNEV